MTGPSLSHWLESYLAIKNALGMSMHAHERPLRSFVQFVEARGEAGPVSAQMALDWACSSGPQCGTAGRASRLSVARKFLSYLHSIDPATEIPSAGLLAAYRRTQPFLFTTQEVQRLMEVAADLRPRNSLRPLTAAAIVGLLASTGLRASEALRLSMADVELQRSPPRLVVRESKFKKSRLVPLHSTGCAT